MHQNGEEYKHTHACIGLAKRSALQNMREQGMTPTQEQGQMLALQYLESGTSECNCDKTVVRNYHDMYTVEEHDVMAQLTNAGFQICFLDRDYEDQPTFDHPALYGVLNMATAIGWGSSLPWYIHDNQFCWILANSEPHIRLDDARWIDRLLLAYVDCLMDRYETLPYDNAPVAINPLDK